jgi:sterol desaturase/sphingolipid hydroxylase (fatty acid hydroxylase superfamily)
MDWLSSIGMSCLSTLAWLAALAVVFGILARLTPCNPGMHWWGNLRAAATDCIYWFAVPLVLRVCRVVLLVVGVVVLFGGRAPHVLPVQDLPMWQQCLGILLFQDVFLYAMHRVFHARWAWKLHAIHHSPAVLDWMSSARFHPLNNLFTFTLADVAVLLLGYSPHALMALVPFNIAYSALVHANLNWTFGPLRYVFASPVFHRWHHTAGPEARDRNFASTFPVLDLIFGTFYMPPGKLPQEFGTGDADVPEAFWAQLIYPFRQALGQSAGQRSLGRTAALVLGGGVVGAGLVLVALYFLGRSANRPGPADGEALAELSRLRALAARLAVPAAPVLRVAISADGRRLVAGRADGLIKVWDAAPGGAELVLTGHKGPVYGVAISPDGRSIASGGYDQTVKVWDATTGKVRLTLTGHKGAVLSVALSADGRRVVSGSADQTAKVWDAATGRPVLTLALDPDAVPCVALSGDGRRVVAVASGSAKVWDADTGRQQLTLVPVGGTVSCVAASNDGRRILTAGWGPMQVWDADTGRPALTVPGGTGPVYCAAFSPDGKHIIAGGKDRSVRVCDAATGSLEFTLTGPTDFVTSVALSSDGPRVVASSRDGTMKVWDDLTSGQSGGR